MVVNNPQLSSLKKFQRYKAPNWIERLNFSSLLIKLKDRCRIKDVKIKNAKIKDVKIHRFNTPSLDKELRMELIDSKNNWHSFEDD